MKKNKLKVHSIEILYFVYGHLQIKYRYEKKTENKGKIEIG